MSLATTLTRCQWGVEAPLVHCEVHLGAGLPHFQLVGLADAGVRESRERVRAALETSGLQFPAGRITVNLAPADIPKEGGRFDLPLAVGLLAASGQLEAGALEGTEFFGELALDGTLRPERSLLVSAARAAAAGHAMVVPRSSLQDALCVPGLRVAGATHLAEVVAHCRGEQPLGFHTGRFPPAAPGFMAGLADVRGQHLARQALELAAAGGHSLLLVGPPGTGKTLLADRLPGLLPPLAPEAALESAVLHTAAGLPLPAFGQRPWRAPHHSATAVSLIGGGQPPRPGEISLAHHGVLFLDELAEYPRAVLDALREPLESRRVSLARGRWHVTFPADSQFLAAMNPCPCGYYPDKSRCRCGEAGARRYLSRLSGPFLDRMDLQVTLKAAPPMKAAHPSAAPVKTTFMKATHPATTSLNAMPTETQELPPENSAAVRERVLAARERQAARGTLNAHLSAGQLREWVPLAPAAGELLEQTAAKRGMSARACHRTLRVARTAADLAGRSQVSTEEVGLALRLRELEALLTQQPALN